MDPAVTTSASSSSRKRSRENETPSQRHKREKAAERQRRKRERDRQAGLNILLQQQQQAAQQAAAEAAQAEATVSAPPVMTTYKPPLPDNEDASPEDVAKREKVRAAARERQRKHRAMVKSKKLRELGLDMGNDIIPPMDDMQYRVADGQYQVLAHDMPAPQQHPHHHPIPHEPPFPQGQPLGGQTFASTLLLSFSCAPLLKQHLLRTLHMTNEELASLEPIIAQAWDHWDQQRRLQYAHAPKPPDGTTTTDPNGVGGVGVGVGGPAGQGNAPPPYATTLAEHPHAFVHDPNPPQASSASPNDFRARFHRPLVAPSPFQAQPHPPPPPPPPPQDASGRTDALDPQLGQARDEAAGVAGKLER
ncbi:hypothetical protein C8Q75DRAFT_788095 [Abortiporus biennis]|nr:hypothetical protein C8Q75DRAFT_788095 [Abortiporus biennis]